MKNKNLIIIAVIILLLIGGGLFLSMNKSTPPPQAPQPKNNSMTSNNPGNKLEQVEGTLKSLLTGGKSVKCTYSNNDQNVSMTGTVYTANGKVRQDYQAKTSTGDTTGHMIIDSQDLYMWSDQMKQGIKMSIAGQPTPAVKNNQTPNIDKAMNFACEPWNADNSLLTLPTDITFQSMSVPVIPPSGAMQQGQTNNSNMCAVCNNIPEGPDRDSCKAQLKCP